MTSAHRGPAQWILPPDRDTTGLRTTTLPPVIARLLVGRGIDNSQKLRTFLHPPHRLPYDPLRLPGMDAAVRRIYRAVQGVETVAVFGDFDVDGITGTAIMLEGLTALGVPVIPYLPTRGEEGHGLSEAAIAKLVDSGASLIVTVDTGITDSGPVTYANSRGAEVIITDHHVPSQGLPPAVACVNPHMFKGELPLFSYPFPDLCGAGIAFKLMQGLYEFQGLPWNPALLELAALGTVADLVPLLDENRYLVTEGMRRMSETRRPGLLALCEAARVSHDMLDTETISFQIVPRLNSAGRMGDPMDSLRLLTTDSAEEAANLAFKLNALNRERRDATSEAMDLAFGHVEALTGLPPILLVASENILPGVAGLVAGRLAERYHRPAIALTLGEENAVASARSIPSFNMIDAISSIEDLLERFGGHSQAAGFTVNRRSLEEATRRLTQYAEERLTSIDLTPSVQIDARADLDEFTTEAHEWLRVLEPFGKGNPRPLFATLGARVLEAQFMGYSQQHLRMRVEQGGNVMTALAFGQAEAWGAGMDRIDLAYTIMEDTRQPGTPLALRVSHFRQAE